MDLINRRLGYLSGSFLIVAYLVFAVVSYLFYPSFYSPYNNWLSDLGNNSRNPSGAIFYDIGVLLAGVLIAVFSIGYFAWRKGLKLIGRISLTIGIGSGVAAGISLAMTGLFTLPLPIRRFLGMLFQINMGDLIVFSTAALVRHRKFMRPIAYLATASFAADFNFSLLNNTPIFELVRCRSFSLLYCSNYFQLSEGFF
jgi:hypothetical protein